MNILGYEIDYNDMWQGDAIIEDVCIEGVSVMNHLEGLYIEVDKRNTAYTGIAGSEGRVLVLILDHLYELAAQYACETKEGAKL